MAAFNGGGPLPVGNTPLYGREAETTPIGGGQVASMRVRDLDAQKLSDQQVTDQRTSNIAKYTAATTPPKPVAGITTPAVAPIGNVPPVVAPTAPKANYAQNMVTP